jgi:hypothetical protein
MRASSNPKSEARNPKEIRMEAESPKTARKEMTRVP